MYVILFTLFTFIKKQSVHKTFPYKVTRSAVTKNRKHEYKLDIIIIIRTGTLKQETEILTGT